MTALTDRGPRAPASPRQARAGLARTRAQRGMWLVACSLLLGLVVLASVTVGSKHIAMDTVMQAVLRPDSSNDHLIVRQFRLPRTVLGLLAGAALGVAGALIQALTRNPLADPGILGVNAGAGFAVTMGVAFFGVGSIGGYLWFSFGGAVAVTVAVYTLGSIGRSGATPIRLTLVGVALGALLGGIASGVTLLRPELFDSMRSWSAGSLAGRNWAVFWAVLPFIAAGLLLALAAARPLNTIALGDDLARSLGARVGRARTVVIVAVTLLAGAATAAVGPVGFVGLMVPHAVRWLVGPDQRWIIPYTIVCSPILLLAADVVGRVVLSPQELRVSVVTAFLGAPVLILLARRRKVSSL